jgi:hypothetical protein
MTYSQNSNIATTDYTALAGLTAAAAPNAAAAVAKAGYLWGVGYGDRGYGQTTPNLGVKTIGSVIGQEWQDLRTVISNLAAWQGTSTVTVPPSTDFNAGNNIKAYPAGNPSYDLVTMLSALDANRFNYLIGNMSVVAGTTTVRSYAWGNASNNISISAEYSMTFINEDQVRFFFNTGGEVRFALSHPSGVTPQDAAWANALNGVVAAFRGNNSYKISGATGNATGIGYYQLNGTWQTIYNGVNSGGGAYSANDYYIEASTSNVAGVNGGNGLTLNFRVTFTDEYTNTVDNVSPGTTVNVTILKASSLALIVPSISTTTTLDASYVPPPPAMYITITGNVQNFVLFDNRINSQYGSAVTINGTYAPGTTINVNVNPGVVVGASSIANFAFDTGTGWSGSDIINLTNNGYIVGAGGNANGSAGGPAMLAQQAITVTNNNIIGGGGGAGGMGQYIYGQTNFGKGGIKTVYAGGGGGGGGAGANAGAGGGVNGSNSGSVGYSGSRASGNDNPYPGTSGSLTAGGAVGPIYGLGGIAYTYYDNAYIVAGGNGGAGGSLGAAGQSGAAGSVQPGITSWGNVTSASAGGAGGACTSGNVNITWAAVGARYGALA